MKLVDLIQAMIDEALDDVHTCLPARVEKFDSKTLRGEVVPLVKRRFKKEGAPEPLPPILDVPFFMPKAGPFVMRWPVKKGDVVLVVFSERALDYILTDGQPQDPQLRRRHALDDAIALPGLLHRGEGELPSEHGGDVLLLHRDNGAKIVLTASGDAIIHTPGKVYLADENASEGAAKGTSLKAWLDSHTHPYSWTDGPGAGNTEPPSSPSPTPSQKVMLE